jgi:hypothetical protein
MTRMNKFFGLLIALLILAFSLPASADNINKKQYSLNYSTGTSLTINGGSPPVSVTIKVANVSPDGVSTFKAFRLFTPPNVQIVGTPSIGSGFTSSPPAVAANGSYVTVDNISPPVKPFDATQGTVFLTMQVQGLCPGASSSTGPWTADIHTGNPYPSGSPFIQSTTTPSNVQTTVTPCSVAINTSTNPTGVGSVSCTSNLIVGMTGAQCTATPPTYGYKLGSWTGGACVGTPTATSLTCNLPSPLQQQTYSVIANFTQYTITPTTTGSGTGSIGCLALDTNGNRVCTATADPNSRFGSWASDCSGTANTCTLLMNSDKSITASFVRQYTVTGTPNPNGSGTVSCTSPVDTGTNSTCTATRNAGDSQPFLTGFSSNCARIGTTNQCTVSNVTADTSVTGNFAAVTPGFGQVGCESSTTNLGGNAALDPDLNDAYVSSHTDVGLRRGANTEGGTNTGGVLCGDKVDVSVTSTDDSVAIVHDKTSGQKATFRYVVAWAPKNPDANGWLDVQILFAYGETAPGSGISLPLPGARTPANGWFPAVLCVDDPDPDTMRTMTPAQLDALLPHYPSVEPYLSSPYPQFQSGVKALACVSQAGVTMLNGQGARWNKVIDEVDLVMGSR